MHTSCKRYCTSLQYILKCALLHVLYSVHDFYTCTHIAYEVDMCPLCSHKAVWNVCTQRKVIKQIHSDVFCVHVVFSMDKLPCDKDLHSKVFWCHEILYSLSQYFSNFPTNFMQYNRQPRNLPCFIEFNSSLPYSAELTTESCWDVIVNF